METREMLHTSDDEPKQTSAADQFLTFIVNGGEYGIDILRVQEIRGWSTPMPLPHAPRYIKGVINIRGDVVPIADLRERLGMPSVSESGMTAIVVLRVKSDGRERIMGFVVDAMSDVTSIPRGAIKPPPDYDASSVTALIRGIATNSDKMVTILEVDALFGGQTAEL